MNQNFEQLPLFLNVAMLASVLDIGRNSAYDLVRSGQIASVKVGKQYRIPRDALLSLTANLPQ